MQTYPGLLQSNLKKYINGGIYEKHQKDLQWLKAIVKEYLPQAYKTIFVKTSEKLNNYVAYVGMTKINGKKILESKRCSKEDFYAFLKKEVCGKLPEKIADELKKELEREVKNGDQKTTT